MKTRLLLLLLIVPVVLLPGCSLITGEDTCDLYDMATDTDFGRMLAYMPGGILDETDIWFDDWALALRLHDAPEATSVAEVLNLTEAQRVPILQALLEIIGNLSWPFQDIMPLVGFDIMSIDRIIYTSTAPYGFSVAEGSFDEGLIRELLAEQGYTPTEYGDYGYYGIHGDYDSDLSHPLAQLVLAAMNRIAVLDDTLIVSPATEDITAVLDAISGSGRAIDNPAVAALAVSLDDVVSGGIFTAERLLAHDEEYGITYFDFDIPEDWSTLHQYRMVGMGYRAEGEERYWVISLYYEDVTAAQTDASELVKRLNSYEFYSMFDTIENIPLTALYTIGNPVVDEYGEGATLTVTCKLPDGGLGASYDMGAIGVRDLLFLAPDPAEYVAD